MRNKLFIGLLVFILYVCTSAVAEFAEVPSSTVVELGAATPHFKCRHTSSEATIFWRVNGSPSGDFPDIRSGSVDESGNIVYTLTIPAEPQYNGTEVVCVAVFLDGVTLSEATPAATIIFLSTVTPIGPPTIAPASFSEVPSPLTVAVEQGTATFQCQHPLADGISWLLNGTPLNRADLSNVSANIQSQGSVTMYILSIGTLIEYNQTTVECVATFIHVHGSPPLFTEPVTLLIQDIPKEVANATSQRDYASNALVTLWSPLPTLDINGTDPDIVYTVQLFRTTCGQNTLINRTTVAWSNVTAEHLDLMQTYKTVVFARNNVPEARNGPSAEMKETFAFLSESTLFHLARNSQFSYMSLDPFPSFYVVLLESLDGLGKKLSFDITVHRNNEMISLTMEDVLPPKSLWNASILAYGCETDTAVTELSTHDLQNIAVNSPLPGEIRVRGDFADGSTATGVLLIIYSLTNDSSVQYIAKQKEQESTFDARVNGLSGTRYGVSVFALEDQLPFQRVVTSPKTVAVAGNNQAMTQQSSIEYHLLATSTGVCVTCTFLDSSVTDCLVVVHQRISSSGLMNIESSHRFNRSLTGNTAYGCIEGISQRQFKVGVAGGRMIMETNTVNERSSPVGPIAAGLALGVLVFIVMVMVTIVVVLMMRKKGIKIQHAPTEPQYTVVRKIHRPVQPEDVECGSPNLEPTPPQEEVEPLLSPPIPPRVVADGTSSPPEYESAAHHYQKDHQDTSGPPPVLGSTDNGGSSDPTYAQPVLLRSLKNTVHPPPTTEKTAYNDIQGFQNQQGQDYALPQVESTSKGGAVDDLHQVVYVKVKPHSLPEQSEHQNIDCTPDHADTPPEPVAAVREPLTTERLFSFLLPHASEWQSLGEALSLDDDRLDEIYTNNETEEACLQEMLEVYMMRSDLDHSWEEIEAALQKIIISSNVSASVQEVSPLEDSPRIGGNIRVIHVPSTHAADANQDGEDRGLGAIHGMDPQSEDSHLTLHQFSSDKQLTHKEDIQNGEQGDSIDSGYSGSHHSESESSDSGTLSKTEQDSREFSDSSEEQSESIEENKPINKLSPPVKDNLDDYRSELNPFPCSQATLKGHDSGSGEFGRTTEKEEIDIVITSPANACSSAGDNCQQVKVFCETVEDPRNEGNLGFRDKTEDWSCIGDGNTCKIILYHQDSQEHKNYNAALKRQMGFHVDQKNEYKSDQHAVEESPQECSSTCKIGTQTACGMIYR